MDIESIFRKPGRDWTPEEIQAVFDWLQREMLDKLVRFATGLHSVNWTKNERLNWQRIW